jgi:hypothetical protein
MLCKKIEPGRICGGFPVSLLAADEQISFSRCLGCINTYLNEIFRKRGRRLAAPGANC